MRQLARIAPARAPVAPTNGAPTRLDTRQKAAIIVRFLIQEGADMPLADLPDELQTALTQQMGAMRYIDRATLEQVVDEFAQELEKMGLTFPRGLAGALTALDGRISPQTAARLRKEAGVRQTGDPWAFIRELPVARLLPMIERESTEVAAVLLSKLPVPKAAELLGAIPGTHARRITYAISLTGKVTPDAVDRIGLSLAAQFDLEPLRAFTEDPEERLGAILNVAQAAKRDEVLCALDEEDQAFSTRVRKAIFTFAHIPARLAPVDTPKLTRDVAPQDLVTALAYSMTTEDDTLRAAADFILGNISKRMAENLREEAAEIGAIKPKDGEAAMTAIINVIRTLQVAGEITLLSPDEDDAA
ncbi:flagellar motor switch protein FliG [Aquicoccus sp. G2-2]|uniref:flagellar motor switch protein FliG n=1 Tax=Aquicoccus sp. G2-2 TaxID=3092120 RepID=UPI002ADFD9E3|nr:FliG C-terminal domain-containing protein [Aquicoccus sp. G2-2]MEA1112804.1 FliG C-terminal domain-containing protein [Aquicoccus sp. G2-2]